MLATGMVGSHLKLYLSVKSVCNYICVSSPVADLGGGVPRVPWNPPFGFSDDRRLWKPGL